jgi:hypothetical protein
MNVDGKGIRERILHAGGMMPEANSPIPRSSFPEVLSVMVDVVKFCDDMLSVENGIVGSADDDVILG